MVIRRKKGNKEQSNSTTDNKSTLERHAHNKIKTDNFKMS